MELLDKFLTLSHIIAGGLVLLTGLLNMVMRPKGGKWHRTIGKVYFWGMLWIALSAFGIITLFRFNLFLLIIAIFSFYLAFSGYRVLKRKKPGQQSAIDWAGAIIALVAGLVLFGVGLKGIIGRGVHPFLILAMVFGGLTMLNARTDIRMFRSTEVDEKQWWWYHHMQAMVGSYIAAFTAFMVQNGDRFFPHFEHQWIFWIGPTLVGTPAIIFWIRHYRAKFGEKKG